MILPAPPVIHPLSLHDALPISVPAPRVDVEAQRAEGLHVGVLRHVRLVAVAAVLPAHQVLRVERAHRTQHVGSLRVQDRKSTRLNSSHMSISYAVFCLK